MAKTNKEILNAIREDASAEYKERVPEIVSEADIMTVASAFENYPTAKAEFINTINAKVFKSVVMNKIYENPLKMLKKGEIPYGQGIEQLFVEMAEKKDFAEKFDGSSEADSLLKKHDSTVLQRFIQRNFAYKYKVSLSNQRLRNAFASANGVANLIDGLVASVMTGANNQEFKDMLDILVRKTPENNAGHGSTADQKGLGKIEKGILERMGETSNQSGATEYFVDVKKAADGKVDPKDLAEKVRTYASEMSFLSKKYNLAKVNTACNPEDLVLFTTSDVVAKLDVHVLAEAFNVSHADVNVRIIKVPMGTFKAINGAWGTASSKNRMPVAVLADREAIQQYDTLVESGSFYNPDQLMTNMFVHRQGITASCDFAQVVAFGYDA